MTDENEYNLNGLKNESLPPLIPGSASEVVRVNSSNTGYELTMSGIVSNPTITGQILNSTGANTYSWTTTPSTTNLSVGVGASNGLKFTGVFSTGLDYSSGVLSLRNGGNNNIQTTSSSVSFASPVTLLTSNSLSTTTGNIQSGGNLQCSVGTTSSNGLNFGQFQNGIYSSSIGNINMYCNAGTSSFQFNDTNHTCQRRILFNRSQCHLNDVLNLGGSYTINNFNSPFIIAINAPSATLNLEFLTTSDYLNGQEFRILTHNQNGGAGIIQYRAQAVTYYFDNSGTPTQIATNTLFNLPNNHYFIWYNVNSSFYLINLN